MEFFATFVASLEVAYEFAGNRVILLLTAIVKRGEKRKNEGRKVKRRKTREGTNEKKQKNEGKRKGRECLKKERSDTVKDEYEEEEELR